MNELPTISPKIEYYTPWTAEDAFILAKEVEAIAPQYGYHVALTGGLLYKEGPRKDCDLVLYRDGNEKYSPQQLLWGLAKIVNFTTDTVAHYRVHKATWRGLPVDIFLPENDGPYSEHPPEALISAG